MLMFSMFKVINIQSYHKYLNAIVPNFHKSLAVMQCKINFHSRCEKPNKSVRFPKIHAMNFNSMGIWSLFKTWSALCNEESIPVEQNDDDKKKPIDPSKDRTKVIPPETSLRYMKSQAYKTTYGDEPVWVKYRRNFKGQFVPKRTRKTCIRGGVIDTGNPCPICRDEYLVLHYTNIELLQQFICPETGEIYKSQIIHICQKRLLELEVAIKKAKFYGYLTHQVPFRKYDYKEYYPQWKE